MPTLPDLAALIDEYAASKPIAPLTRKSIRDVLHVVLPRLPKPPSELTPLDVQRWIATYEQAPSTARTRLSVLRGFFGYLVLTGRIAADPTTGVRPPREPRRLPRGMPAADVAAVLAIAPDTRTRLMVLLMVQEGLRRKEVAGLQLGDVDLDDGTVRIIGKGGHERVLPLTAETLGVLRSYVLETGVRAGALFRCRKDKSRPLAPVTVGRIVSDLMWRAGVKERPYDGKSAHALRHTAATDMLKHGAHVRDVQAALGHAHLVTTERYLAWEVRGLRDAMNGRRYLPGPRPMASGETAL